MKKLIFLIVILALLMVRFPAAPEIVGVPELTPTVEPTVTPESKLVFWEDFDVSGLPGWNVRPGETGKVTADRSWLKLEAELGTTFPVVEREDIFPPEGSFEITFKVDFPDKTGCGVAIVLEEEDGRPILHVSGGRCANPFVRAALNNGEEVSPFLIYPQSGWDGSLSNPDVPHVFSLYYDSEERTGYLAIDDTYVGQLSSFPRPVGVRMGNPTTTTEWGAWTQLEVDFLEVRQASEPSFAIPKEPPSYELVLFGETDGQEIRKISTLSLPSGDDWALEIELTFSNFSPDMPASVRLGDLEIRGGKGWKPYVVLSAGKAGERFGFLITADVGKPVKGKESLYRPKKTHTIRVVYLGATEYLYVDGILVGQGPRGDQERPISVKIVEDESPDATKVTIDSIKLFDVTCPDQPRSVGP